jgi:hypothetical protein
MQLWTDEKCLCRGALPELTCPLLQESRQTFAFQKVFSRVPRPKPLRHPTTASQIYKIIIKNCNRLSGKKFANCIQKNNCASQRAEQKTCDQAGSAAQ